MKLKPLNLLAAACAIMAIQGCEDLTTRDESVTIELDSFNLVGTGTAEGAAFTTRAVVSGNPACTASQVSLNGLLAQVDNYDDIDEYLDTLDINSIRYRITANTTPVDASGVMQMTDNASGQLTTIASIDIPANQTVNEWTLFPFVEGGAAIVRHYMDNRDAQFLYCAQGSPDRADLSMTIDLQMDLTVTVDLL